MYQLKAGLSRIVRPCRYISKAFSTNQPTLHFDNTFTRSFPQAPAADQDAYREQRQVRELWCSVKPVPCPSPKLLALSERVASKIGLVTHPAIPDLLAGNTPFAGSQPFAANYGGIQFGNWAGQLGDGRAMSLGEVVNKQGERWELQLKGAGKTPFSRQGDGLAVLRSSVREFLASEAMHHLGVPTTHALALVSTGNQVLRDMFYNGHAHLEPGAVVARVAPSFLRMGTYQLLAVRGDEATLTKLVDYTLERHYPELLVHEGVERRLALLERVMERTADLIAKWQAFGFVHGVMNSDNMSVLGLTLDYGPFAFMERYDPEFTANLSDSSGLYAYAKQPEIGAWQVSNFAAGLMLLPDHEAAVKRVCDQYFPRFTATYHDLMRRRLGLATWRVDAQQPRRSGLSYGQSDLMHRALGLGGSADAGTGCDDGQLLDRLLQLMAAHDLDYTSTWRALADHQQGKETRDQHQALRDPESSAAAHARGELTARVLARARPAATSDDSDWADWLLRYERRLAADTAERIQTGQRPEPAPAVSGSLAATAGCETHGQDRVRPLACQTLNPNYVLRNYLAHRAIQAAEQGDTDELHRLWAVLREPWHEQPEGAAYAELGPDELYRPGICQLSCSS